MLRMPGRSFRSPLPPMTGAQQALAAELQRDVTALAGAIGPRNVLFPKGLRQSETFLERELSAAGYEVQRQTFRTFDVEVCNFEVEIRGSTRPDEIVIVGAHYDSVESCPAANDNGSGVAATLALARRFAPRGPAASQSAHSNAESTAAVQATPAPARTLRFVFFVNEEPPHFQTDDMGSVVYAKRCRERSENIIAMLSLETIGYYSDAPGSQEYPIKPIGWLYPDQGNFLAFVGNHDSRALVRQSIASFRRHARFPSEGAALPGWITGVGWSDHWAFWQQDYPAIMLTDTAPFRYPHYHLRSDTPDKLQYDRFARAVEGIEMVVRDLISE